MNLFWQNKSFVHEFIFQGFSVSEKSQLFIFVVILNIYLFTLFGNLLIGSLVCLCPSIQNPMYIFLGNFSFTEICYTTVILPQILVHTQQERKVISYIRCLLQLYFCSSFGTTECLLLSVMAYDRYLAICHPLQYTYFMRRSVCTGLTLFTWVGGLLGSLLPLLMVSDLVFCGPNQINHFFCDSLALFKLSCTETVRNKLFLFLFASAVVLGSSVIIIISYWSILWAIMKVTSSTGKKKAFSTCASHLSVVSIFYGTLIFTYVATPSLTNPEINKGLSILYTVITPMLNPIIYSLRNADIHSALSLISKKYLKKTFL